MNAALAIYDALIQARVSPDAAKAVVDALDRDMNTWLATKQDFRHFEQLLELRFDAFEARSDARFSAFERRSEMRFAAFEASSEARLGRFEERLGGFEARLNVFEALLKAIEARTDLKLQRMEGVLRQEMKGLGSQLTIRLGVLITGLLGAAVALQTLLR